LRPCWTYWPGPMRINQPSATTPSRRGPSKSCAKRFAALDPGRARSTLA
jgi:hypothetical protein